MRRTRDELIRTHGCGTGVGRCPRKLGEFQRVDQDLAEDCIEFRGKFKGFADRVDGGLEHRDLRSVEPATFAVRQEVLERPKAEPPRPTRQPARQ
jgi:hypothetical protein